MECVVPWQELQELIEPYYPKAGHGRQPIGLSIMLRVYFLQHWFNLSDPGAEDALYESSALRRFAGVDLHPTDEDLSVGTPTLAVHRHRMKRASCAFATCSKSMSGTARFWMR